MPRFPIVYRMKGLDLSGGLAGVRFHGERTGGDLSHITPPELYEEEGRSAPVETFFDREGKEQTKPADWVKDIRREANEAAQENLVAQVKNLEAKGNKKGAARRQRQGPKPAFRQRKSSGPLRELVLSANAEYFQAEDGKPGHWNKKKVRDFYNKAVAFLKKEWGPALRYARLDLDEEAPHIHAVAAPWVETTTKGGAVQRMLTPRRHKGAEDAEKAQDRAGEWFASIGLKRGERRAQARREALARGDVPEHKKRHISPAQWRRDKAEELKAKEADLEKREKMTDAILKLAPQVKAGAVEDFAKRQAVEAAQAEAKRRETEKAKAIEEAKKSKAKKDAAARRKAAIQAAARAKAAKAKAETKKRNAPR